MKILIETTEGGFVNLDYVASIDVEEATLGGLWLVTAKLVGKNIGETKYLFAGTKEKRKSYLNYLGSSIRKPNEARVINLPESMKMGTMKDENTD